MPRDDKELADMPRLQCRAHTLAGTQCKRTCVAGAVVCHWHGGAAPQCKRAESSRQNLYKATRRAVNWLKQQGYTKVDDPVEALSQLAGEVWAAKDFFASQIEQLRYDHRSGEQLRAEVALYERALDRCIKVLEVMARLGISERRTRVAEAQAIMLAGVIDRVLDRLDLDEAQRMLALEIVPEELLAITAPEAEEQQWTGVGTGLLDG